jgi:hypothetical protein
VRAAIVVLVLALALVAGCDSEEAPSEPSRAAIEKRVVRQWISALNKGDYKQAARYFAKGAIVDQGQPIKLPDAAAARIFNASLPCRATLTRVEDEPGPKALASFALRAGPGGPCDGAVQVRVTIEDGRFTEWRQLPEAPEPTGPLV